MAKKTFAFNLGQRVPVPGNTDVQGIVSLPRFKADFELPPVLTEHEGPLFFVIWLKPDGERGFAWFTAGELSSGTPIAAPVSKAMRKLRARRRLPRVVI